MSDLTAADWFLGLLDATGSGRNKATYLRQCPAHRDAGPSLSVADGTDGQALVRCYAGCALTDIAATLRIPMRWLFRSPPVEPAAFAVACLGHLTYPPVKLDKGGSLTSQGYRFESHHEYGDSQWRKERLRRASDGEKAVRWEARNPRGEWVPGLLGARERDLPLYLERDLRPALGAGEPILVVESESSVDALVRHGWYATTWCGGAGSVHVHTLRRVLLEHPAALVIPDHDEPGLRAAARIGTALPQVRTLLGEPGEDARDLLRRLGAHRFTSAVDATLRAPTAERAA